jgi:Mu transposase-like protein
VSRCQVRSDAGLLHFTHNGVLVATHAKRHLDEADAKFEGRRRALRPSRPTTGDEVIRMVDCSGAISFAGTGYRVGNRYRGQKVGVRTVADTVQITMDGSLVRTHRARHDQSKEYGALAQPNGKPRRSRDGVA